MYTPRDPSGLEVELFHMVRADEARARGDTVSAKINDEAAQFAAISERKRMERFTRPKEEKKAPEGE